MDSLVVAADGRTFAPGLRQLRVHGSLGRYLVLSGFGCDDCDATRTLHVLRFGEHVSWDKRSWQPAFAYPGTVWDTDNQPIARSRLFFGQCGTDSDRQVIQFAHVLTRDGRWTDSIHVAAVRNDSIVSMSAAYTLTQLELVIDRTRLGKCVEVPGKSQVEP